jgi:hypothetical protein
MVILMSKEVKVTRVTRLTHPQSLGFVMHAKLEFNL